MVIGACSTWTMVKHRTGTRTSRRHAASASSPANMTTTSLLLALSSAICRRYLLL